MAPPTLQALFQKLTTAVRPADVFGTLPADTVRAREVLGSAYRLLARVAHPDRNPLQPALAAATFGLLEQWRRRAMEELTPADAAPVTLKTRRNTYTLGEPLGEGDYFTRFRAVTAAGVPCTLKLAGGAGANDLVERDVNMIRRLGEHAALGRYLPRVLECFLTDDGTDRRQAAVFATEPAMLSAERVMGYFPGGLDPRDAAWMFNRLLEALALAHDRGVIHGAPLPVNMVPNLDTHGIELAEWAYAAPCGEPLAALPAAYEGWYPPEVFAKKPATPATDLYLAARTLLFLLGANPLMPAAPASVPAPIGRMINACLLPAPHRRPQAAGELHAHVKDVLRSLYGPPAFRPFPRPVSAA